MSGSTSVYSGKSAGNRRAGVASATIDGEVVDVASDLTYDATTVKRTTLEGQSSVQGFSETPKSGSMAFTARDSGNLVVSSMMGKTASTLVFVLANGKTVSGDNMWCTQCDPVNTSEATFALKFEAFVVTEFTA